MSLKLFVVNLMVFLSWFSWNFKGAHFLIVTKTLFTFGVRLSLSQIFTSNWCDFELALVEVKLGARLWSQIGQISVEPPNVGLRLAGVGPKTPLRLDSNLRRRLVVEPPISFWEKLIKTVLLLLKMLLNLLIHLNWEFKLFPMVSVGLKRDTMLK